MSETVDQPVPLADLPDEADRIYFEANRLLQLINQAAVELELDDTLPTSQYLDIDQPVHDCPMLAVAIGPLTLGIPGAPPLGIGEFGTYDMDPAWTLSLVADIARCSAKPSSGGTVSPKSKLTGQVQQASRDAAILIRAANLRRKDHWGYLAGSILPLEPQGATYGVRLSLQVALH